MKVLVVDDEKNAREAIVTLMELYFPDDTIIYQAESVHSAIDVIYKTDPNLLLLDVRLKDGSGFDILKKLGTISIPVIFITAYEEFAIRAFKVSALDYLLKPIDPDELQQAVMKAKQKIEKEKIADRLEVFTRHFKEAESNRRMVLKTADAIFFIQLEDIIYCQAEGAYTRFFLAHEKPILVSRSLGEYEEMINNRHFIRVHQSFLVNMNRVIRYEKGDGGNLIVYQEQSIPVSIRKKETVLDYMNNLH